MTDGRFGIDLEANPGNTTITQQVSGLTNGEQYYITFDVTVAPPDNDARLEVYWGGQLLHWAGDNPDAIVPTLS